MLRRVWCVQGERSLPEYFNRWLSTHAEKDFIVYQNERYTFRGSLS
jgi:hypothetical protein